MTLFDEVITTSGPLPPPPRLQQAFLRALCHLRGRHTWQDYGPGFDHGVRQWCQVCEANRVVVTQPDGRVFRTVEASAAEVCAGKVEFAEALYEARWGEQPHQRMRAGEWPAP